MAAFAFLYKSQHLVIALPRTLFFRGVIDLVDEVGQQANIALLPQQKTIRRFAVTSSTTRFLVVLFDGLRQRKMDYGANRGLVYAKSKRNRPHHHAYFVAHPAFLVALAFSGSHLSVV